VLHRRRVYDVADVDDAAVLAGKMAGHSWCLCCGFRFAGHLLLNDAFSEDGAAEYAVVRESDGAVVESITASWMSEAEVEAFLVALAAGDFTGVLGTVQPRLQHGDTCRHCA